MFKKNFLFVFFFAIFITQAVAWANKVEHKLSTSQNWLPADYVKKDSFIEEEITIGKSPWKLPGTITLPKGKGPFPVVVLVHGSGPSDRDETVVAIRLFKDLAWGLATKNIAVFRYDKRTLHYRGKINRAKETYTVEEEVIEDAIAAISMLQGRKDVDNRRIFLLGHSLGGMLAPRIAKRVSNDLKGLIILAGSTRPLQVLLVEQLTYMAKLDGKIDDSEEEQIQLAKSFQKEVDSPKLQANAKLTLLGTTIAGSYFLDLRTYDPVKTASTLSMPIFIAQGKRDFQVTQKDFAVWKRGLASQKSITFHSFPNLNHLFVAGKAPSTPNEYAKPGNISVDLINALAFWIYQN